MSMQHNLRSASIAAVLLIPTVPHAGAAQEQVAPWQSRCVSESRAAPATCTLSHGVFLSETGQLLFGITLASIPEQPDFRLSVTGPLGLQLADGLELLLDGRPWISLPISTCDSGGCHAALSLPDSKIEEISASEMLTIHYVPEPGRERDVPVPLLGFSEGLAAIR